MDRVILHCDCNSFYASVECVLSPQLREVPMAVAGDPENRRGIILAKNEKAKAFGVQTAETIWQAARKCPGLVLVPPRHGLYEAYSRRLNELYLSYTDLVERFGIDESWLDVTASRRLFGDGRAIADGLRARVRKETGLTVSVGVSFNKVFAKLGSDYKKPDATTVITRENFKELLYPLPARDLLLVGKRTAAQLERMNIKTIGDLAAADRAILRRLLGKTGEALAAYARGEEDSPVASFYEQEEAKSIGNGMTFRRDLLGEEDVRCGVMVLADTVASRMRAHGVWCSVVQVMIKTPDFKTISRQKTLERPTHLSRAVTRAAMELICEAWPMDKPIRMLTVTGQHLVREPAAGQVSLFAAGQGEEQREERLESAIDAIRSKYGKGAVMSGAVLDNDLGISTKKTKSKGSESSL